MVGRERRLDKNPKGLGGRYPLPAMTPSSTSSDGPTTIDTGISKGEDITADH